MNFLHALLVITLVSSTLAYEDGAGTCTPLASLGALGMSRSVGDATGWSVTFPDVAGGWEPDTTYDLVLKCEASDCHFVGLLMAVTTYGDPAEKFGDFSESYTIPSYDTLFHGSRPGLGCTNVITHASKATKTNTGEMVFKWTAPSASSAADSLQIQTIILSGVMSGGGDFLQVPGDAFPKKGNALVEKTTVAPTTTTNPATNAATSTGDSAGPTTEAATDSASINGFSLFLIALVFMLIGF